jgi:hypothetical protein
MLAEYARCYNGTGVTRSRSKNLRIVSPASPSISPPASSSAGSSSAA